MIVRFAIRILLVAALLLQNALGSMPLNAETGCGHCDDAHGLTADDAAKCPCCPVGTDAATCAHLCAPLVGLVYHGFRPMPVGSASVASAPRDGLNSFRIDPPTRPPIA